MDGAGRGRRYLGAGLGALLWAGTVSAGSPPREGELEIARERRLLVSLARDARPAVVALFTETAATAGPGIHKGLGSGFFIHPDGYLLTSQHVVQGASRVRVQPAPETGLPETEAQVLGEDETADVALLKVELGRPVPVLRLGRSAPLQVADWIMAIGNPFGLPHTVSVGIVSFKGRTGIHPGGRGGEFEFIQTDAAINPGSSGGPLLGLDGEVVAMANAVNVSGQGIAFAQPAEAVEAALLRLWPDPVPRRSWLGLRVRDASAGVEVESVQPGGPAAAAGLRPGDVILSLDDRDAPLVRALAAQLALTLPGSPAALRVLRNGRALTLSVRGAAAPVQEGALRPPGSSAM